MNTDSSLLHWKYGSAKPEPIEEAEVKYLVNVNFDPHHHTHTQDQTQSLLVGKPIATQQAAIF